jgi:hypothetical protein
MAGGVQYMNRKCRTCASKALRSASFGVDFGKDALLKFMIFLIRMRPSQWFK